MSLAFYGASLDSEQKVSEESTGDLLRCAHGDGREGSTEPARSVLDGAGEGRTCAVNAPGKEGDDIFHLARDRVGESLRHGLLGYPILMTNQFWKRLGPNSYANDPLRLHWRSGVC